MNTLKAIQTYFPSKNQASVPRPRKFANRQRLALCFCNSDESGSGSSSSYEGDKRKQELLARIAMLQAQKVRLTDFLDERSAYLTQFTEDANAEFDEIGEKAMKELDEAGDRVCNHLAKENNWYSYYFSISFSPSNSSLFVIYQIMEKLEGRMQAFEETADMSREEIEKNEKVLEEFKDQIEKDRNEGLFFKNLREKGPQAKAEAKLEAGKLKEIAKENAGSKVRRNIYLGLMSLVAITIANAVFATTQVEWGKLIALVFIFLGLLAQFFYEQSLSKTSEARDKKGE